MEIENEASDIDYKPEAFERRNHILGENAIHLGSELHHLPRHYDSDEINREEPQQLFPRLRDHEEEIKLATIVEDAERQHILHDLKEAQHLLNEEEEKQNLFHQNFSFQANREELSHQSSFQIHDNQFHSFSSNEADRGAHNHNAEQRNEHNANDLNIENQFYQNRIHYLYQNINNLNEILGLIMNNSDVARSLNSNINNLNNVSRALSETLQSLQANIINNQNEISGQLEDIRRILGLPNNGAGNNNRVEENLGNNLNRQDVQAEQGSLWKERVRERLNMLFRRAHRYTRTTQFKLDMIFMMSAMSLIICLHSIPQTTKTGVDIIDWLESSRTARSLLLSIYVFLTLVIWYFFKMLWLITVGEYGRNEIQVIEKGLLKFNPFENLALVILCDTNLIKSNLEFTVWSVVYFFNSMIMVYNNLSLKETQKYMNALEAGSNESSVKLRKLKAHILLIFSLNLVFTSLGIWATWYAGPYLLAILFHQSLLNAIDAIKILYSIQIVENNHLYYSNPNTPTVDDPKLRIELVFNSLFHGVRLLHFINLIVNHAQWGSYITFNIWGVVMGKQVSESFIMLRKNYRNYHHFRDLASTLELLYPVAGPDELEHNEDCAICHEPLKLARKLPCSHMFHIKCLFNWFKSKKNTCPICRQVVGNFANEQNHVFRMFGVPITIPERIRWAWNFFFSEIELSESQPDLHAQAGDQNAEQEFIEE